jgi:hypothetical protein
VFVGALGCWAGPDETTNYERRSSSCQLQLPVRRAARRHRAHTHTQAFFPSSPLLRVVQETKHLTARVGTPV